MVCVLELNLLTQQELRHSMVSDNIFTAIRLICPSSHLSPENFLFCRLALFTDGSVMTGLKPSELKGAVASRPGKH